MKITNLKDTYENYNDIVKITDFEHFFNVYQDSDNNFMYNLNSNLYFNIDDSEVPHYIVQYPSHWTLISYNIYGTTRLAWLLMKMNDVKQNDVFKIVDVGTRVRYMTVQNVQSLIQSIR